MGTPETEEWRAVVGHEGSYEVSSLGRVRSLDRVCPYERRDKYSGRMLSIPRVRKGQILRPGRKPDGHWTVALGRGKSKDIHRLVLEAFVGPCPPGMESLHADDDPDHNALVNLRWGTRSDNLLDAVRNGKKAVGEKAPNAKLKANDVLTIRRRLMSEGPCAIARDYNINESSVRMIRDRISWKHL